MNYSFPRVLVIILITGIFLSGCSAERQVNTKITQNSITIAVVYPVGDIDNFTGFWNGIELAVSEINKNGGITGRQVNIIKKDDKGSVTKGLALAESLAENKKITAVIGHWNSRVSLPAAEVYENAGKLMITPASTSPELTQKNYKYIFQQIIDDTKIARKIAFFASLKGFKRMAIFYADDAYGRGLVNSFSRVAENNGVKIVDRISELGNDLSVKRLVNKWQALDADGLFVADVLPRAGIAIKRLREAGLNLTVIGATGLDRSSFLEYKELVEGSYVPTLFNPLSTEPNVRKFTSNYKEKYGKFPDTWAAQAFDTVMLLREAIIKADSTSSDQIAGVMHQLSNWPGVTGELSFNEQGEVTGEKIYFQVVQNSKFQVLPEFQPEEGGESP